MSQRGEEIRLPLPSSRAASPARLQLVFLSGFKKKMNFWGGIFHHSRDLDINF